MVKFLFYIPTHVLNLIRATLLPRGLFIATYKMSPITIREQEAQARNKLRLAAYRVKRGMK